MILPESDVLGIMMLCLSHEEMRELVKELLVEARLKGSENKELIEKAQKVLQNLE